MPLATRTGNFPIGFRQVGWSDWQKDMTGVIAWAKKNDIAVIDPTNDGDVNAKAVISAGMRVGTVEFPDWSGLISPDAARRKATVSNHASYIERCTAAGAKNFFVVMLPEKPELPRAENFGYMIDGLKALVPVLEKCGGRLAIEGWPGPGALCCTPESYRATFKEVPSKALGINYDPSHLIRMGIDPIRFLNEFADRVVHVHGKDTQIVADALYEFGNEQPATWGKGQSWGGMHWRYTIPGHGQMKWSEAFAILAKHGYKGCVSVELEDGNYNGTEAGEQKGIQEGTRFLQTC